MSKIKKALKNKAPMTIVNKTKGTTDKTVKPKQKLNKAELDKKNIKETVKMAVESQREIKYKYPEEINNQLDRKTWRQKVRNKLDAFVVTIDKMKKSNDAGLPKKEKEYQSYRKQVLMVP